MYGIYHRICRIYLIICLFESKLLLIFTNPKRCAAHFSAGGFQLTLFRSGCAKFLRIRIGMRRFLVITYWRRTALAGLSSLRKRLSALENRSCGHLGATLESRVTPEEKRRFLAQRAQETEQRRALFNAETDAETT